MPSRSGTGARPGSLFPPGCRLGHWLSAYKTACRHTRVRGAWKIEQLRGEEHWGFLKNYLGPIYELRRKLGDVEFLELMTYIENANKKMSKD